jgi:hypothetical protein
MGEQLADGDRLVFFAGMLQVNRNIIRAVVVVAFENVVKRLH